MTTIADTHEFEFPSEPTRREKQLFSKHAGIAFTSFSLLAQRAKAEEEGDEDAAGAAAEFAAVWDDAEPALVLIAAQRINSAVTYDQVMDTNGWTLVRDMEAAAGPLEPSSETTEATGNETPETIGSTSLQI